MAFCKISLAALAAVGLSACNLNGGTFQGESPLSSGSGQTVMPQNGGQPLGKVSVSVDGLKKFKLEELRSAVGVLPKQSSYSISVGGKQYKEGEQIMLPKGMNNFDVQQRLEGTVQGEKHWATESGKLRAYQQDYSVVAGYERKSVNSSVPRVLSGGAEDMEVSLKGSTTTTLPTAGTYTYSGKAFSQNEDGGTLNYSVNFDKGSGQGTIDNISQTGRITLHEGRISGGSYTAWDGSKLSGHGISSTASSEKMGNGKYELGFFGPNAEEIAGAVYNNNGVVGFGGKR